MQDHWDGYLKAIGALPTPKSTNTPEFETKPSKESPKDMSIGWESLSIFKNAIPDPFKWFENKHVEKK